jgi:uncharacterized protein DUF1883
MDYLHHEFDLGPDDVIEVVLDHPANVQLLDPTNFDSYQNGKPFRYLGGYVTTSPYRVRPPHVGRWHLVVDLGGGPGSVRASARVFPLAAAS